MKGKKELRGKGRVEGDRLKGRERWSFERMGKTKDGILKGSEREV